MSRKAVGVLLTPSAAGSEVLLVRRSNELTFFGGYDAFPGGTLEAQDDETFFENVRPPAEASPDYPRFVAAAARELFEETGVLLARGAPPPSPEKLRPHRKRLLAGETTFAQILREEKLVVDGNDFQPLCRIMTPPFQPRRYDTWFFCSVLPDGTTFEIWPGELVSGEVLRAEEALTGWLRGDRLIVPPVVIFLKELAAGSLTELLPRARALTDSYASGKLHRVYFTPGVLLAPLKTPTRPPATHTNCYVVGEERLYVIDPASGEVEEQERLWELLDDLVREGRRLEAILLTHYHPDHVGGVAEARRRYRLPVYGHPDTARALPGLALERELRHGETLPLGAAPDGRPDWALRVYHVPGHAPGHLAFQEDRYEALLVGDLVSTLSSILIDPRDGNLVEYMKSLEFLEGVATATLYPGHGPPARDGRRAIRVTIEHRRERERALVAALGREPQNPAALVARVYADVDPKLHPLAERSLLSGLIKLVEEGRVARTGEGYVLKGE